MSLSSAPFSLYVHIPYCVSKCPYCDFNSYGVGLSAVGETNPQMPEERYADALIGELTQFSKNAEWAGREIETVFVGGGTPSLFSPGTLARILEATSTLFSLCPSAEVTLEANPGTIQEKLGRDKLRGFRSAGFNRVSMGVQSFSPEKLKFLGRIHSAGDVSLAVENIVKGGFENFNLDLIFGVEGEELSDWKREVRSVLELQPKHISAYSLIVEPGTEFYRFQSRGGSLLANEEVVADMLEYNAEVLPKAGYQQYEISNYAEAKYQCRHNLGYWTGRDYLGIGAGAHSFLSTRNEAGSFGRRWSNIPGPGHYIERVLKEGAAQQREEVLGREEAELEFFSLGLRTANGIDTNKYRTRFGDHFARRYSDYFEKLAQKNLVHVDESVIRLTPRGKMLSDGVFSEIAVLAGIE